jgi:excinuclease UvrABC ATPase subunit
MPRSQRRYLESVSPYARRLFHQMAVPEVDAIEGLPPAVALQQQRGSPTTRSSVGSVTTLSNLLRMLYSRAGDYAPCPTCKGARYNAKTLEIKIRDQSIADVLAMTVDSAFEFFADDPPLQRSLGVIREVGLGYIRLGQSATELSGGEAQRVKLATELQRAQRGATMYVLDEPTTGLHPSDVDKLMKQLDGLVASGNTVVVVEHDMDVVAGSDWIIDIGPGAGDEGGRIVASGPPEQIVVAPKSRTASYLARAFGQGP